MGTFYAVPGPFGNFMCSLGSLEECSMQSRDIVDVSAWLWVLTETCVSVSLGELSVRSVFYGNFTCRRRSLRELFVRS